VDEAFVAAIIIIHGVFLEIWSWWFDYVLAMQLRDVSGVNPGLYGGDKSI
jgi:hypothetical protein